MKVEILKKDDMIRISIICQTSQVFFLSCTKYVLVKRESTVIEAIWILSFTLGLNMRLSLRIGLQLTKECLFQRGQFSS
uniref:Uncharacterized protein n=1 Tax=Anguilla anguilla TaxID=7936 RepID=A0A0E9X5K3_ANGAN